jgi:hypothetical protein
MNKYLQLIFITVCAIACQQPGSNQSGSTDSAAVAGGAEDTAVTVAANNPYFYIRLKGTVANQPVTMHLIKSGPHVYRGYYLYDKIGEPIDIWGSPDSSRGQQTKIYENGMGSDDVFFDGKLDLEQGAFEGTWRSKRNTFPFSLKTDFNDAVRFDVFYVQDSTPLLPGRSNSPVAVSTDAIVWPAAGVDGATAGLIKKAITGGKDIPVQELLKRNVDSFLNTYKAGKEDFDTASLKDETMGASWNWTGDSDMKIVWNQHPLLVLENSDYEYTGGAHGNGGNSYRVFDLAKQKLLTPADVFKDGYKKALGPELEHAFRKKYNVPKNETVKSWLLVDRLEPNDNFILTNKGVVFSYTPYEIAAYALGQVDLFIPYEKIKAQLKEDYSK